MEISKLREIAKGCRHNPNYQYKDTPDSEFQEAANKSFQRLPEGQRLKVINSWKSALERTGEEPKSGAELSQLRYLAQTNLYFLCKLLEKYSQTTINTHEEMCNVFFVRKDPTFTTFEKFATQYTDLKDRMLLVPRGGFKSSLNMADTVQWIICFPAVTVLILTGVYKLAGDFVGEVKQHFTLEENGVDDGKGKSGYRPRSLLDAETGEWSSSLFQVLFPEHCIAPNDGTQFEFQTPAGGDDKEPTLRAASIEQALSGMHFGILALDDVVTNENSQTPDRIDKINKQVSINRAMLHPYGFQTIIGTWYDNTDLYGKILKQEEDFAKEEGLLESIKGSVDSGRFNSSVYVKVYLRACWWPTEAAAKAGKIEAEMKKDDWEYWFPERLPYEFLAREKKKDPDGFAIKYLNNPRQISRVKFPRELLMRRTIPHSQLPPSGQGIVVTTVDAAYSTKSWADYTVIMTALIFAGRFYIINMVRGRFNDYEMPAVIANTAYKWRPKRVAVEDSMGVRWLTREIRREMDRLQISIPVEFCSLGHGSKARSKQMKAKPVLRLLGDDRMFFLNSCEGLQDIYNELEKFTGTQDDTHDDIVSAISLLAEQFGAYADMGQKMSSVDNQYVADKQSKERYDQLYGMGRFARFNSALDDNPVTAFQMERAGGPGGFVSDADIDPLSDAGLF